MGWASGSDVAQDLWDKVRDNIIPEKRKESARIVIKVFEDRDADAWDYKRDLFTDAGYRRVEYEPGYMRVEDENGVVQK